MFDLGLIVLAVLGILAGFLLGALIFGKETDGTMYFWTDIKDGHVYIQAQFDNDDIHVIEKKKSLSFRCVEIPPIKDDDLAIELPQEKQGI